MQNRVTRKEALAFLKDTENGVLIGDLWGYISKVNKALVKMFGANSKDEFMGKHVLAFLVENEREQAVKNSLDSIANSKGKIQAYKARLKNGEIASFEVKTMLIANNKGENSGFVDIIKRTQ